MQSFFRGAALAAAGLLLVACGGGGDGGSGGGGADLPPIFSSSGSVSIAEGASGAFYTAIAADPNNNPLSFTIEGGGDGSRFSINGTSGGLSFVNPPDFENPTDANGDNVYQLTLRVSDGFLSATLGLNVTVTNRAATIRVRLVGSSLSQPLFLAGLTDGSGRVYVVQKGGLILILNPATGITESSPFINLSSQISIDGERGLLGFALAPNFATSRAFYVYLTVPGGNIEVRRYLASAANPNVADVGTADVILTIPHTSASNHNGGWIGFGADGFLYLGVGDGGNTPNLAQDANSLLGKMLRIDVASDAFPADANRDYAIPSGNPFASSGGAPEVWAMGLRNPFRNGFDATTGDLFVADVGQNAIEEINRLRAPLTGGANFGWPFFEGTSAFSGTPPGGFVHTTPVTQYTHGTGATQGETVIGGYIYRGPVASLQGHYLFADFIDGHVWSLPESSLAPGTTVASTQFVLRDTEFRPDSRTIDSPSSFGLDQAGNIYIVDFDGDIFRIDSEE